MAHNLRKDECFNWDETAEERLRTLWVTNLSCAAIGREMGGGLSANAISGKGHRMGLPNRDTFLVYTTYKVNGKFASRVLKKALRRPRKAFPALEAQSPINVDEPAPEAFLGVPDRPKMGEPCCWVLQEGKHPVYCDAPSVKGKSMCQAHRDIAVRPPEPAKYALAAE